MDDVRSLLALWFDDVGADEELASSVGRLLRFNQPADPGTVDEGVQVLVVENQGVWLWGVDAQGRYVERENQPGEPWRPTGESDDEFWLHHAAFEAAMDLTARRRGQDLDAAAVERIVEATEPLPCGRWRWPGTGHVLRRSGRSVVMVADDDGGHWVVAAAPTEDDLGWLDALDLVWDESDSRARGG